MVWSNAKDGFVNLFQNEKFNLETNFKISRIFYLGYKPNLSFEPRVFISDFDGSVIKVDDEEKVINASNFNTTYSTFLGTKVNSKYLLTT